VNINDRIVASTFLWISDFHHSAGSSRPNSNGFELIQTPTGLLIIAAAMIVDVLGWIVFSVILSLQILEVED